MKFMYENRCDSKRVLLVRYKNSKVEYCHINIPGVTRLFIDHQYYAPSMSCYSKILLK